MSKPKSVCIINSDPAYVRMFEAKGWIVQDQVVGADLIQFTGGEDVTPSYYGQLKHPSTCNNPSRDHRETLVFAYGLKERIPMAGICRGGQFLNVMCGGAMWQDVDGHCGSHQAFDDRTGKSYKVTSTHHQMMLPSREAVTIMWARQSTKCTKMAKDGTHLSVMDPSPCDTEAVYYPGQRVFCFQPHPEFYGENALADLYFSYINELLFEAEGT